jgi:hypothetical protein
MKDRIITELRKFEEFQFNQRMGSFVIFNLIPDEKSLLWENIETEFIAIYYKIKSLRDIELNEMLKEIDWIREKYSELHERYRDTNKVSDIFQWENDSYEPSYKYIIDKETNLKLLYDNFHLEDINIEEIDEKKRLINKFNSEMDFYNLMRYQQDKEFKRYYILTQKEKEYNNLQSYLSRKRFAEYILCYNEDYNPILENLFKSDFKWDRLKWSIFGFQISRQEFERQANDFVKEELYYNREIIE